MSNLVTLAFLNFTKQQQEIFTSILFLSERSLDSTWNIGTKETAKVIFVISEKTISQTQWDKMQLAYPQAILVAYSVNLVDLNTPWKLLTETTALTNRTKLITLLNQINQDAFKNIEQEIPKEIVIKKSQPIEKNIEQETQKTIKNHLFLPEDYFLSIVQMSIKTGYIYRCKIEEDVVIYLLPKQNCYFCSTEITDLKTLFLMSPKEIKVKRMLDSELKQQIEGLKTKALNDLLWYATVTASQGRFMTTYQPDDSVYLKSWPDISLVSENKSYLDIAAFMSHNTTNVVGIAKKSQQKLTDVIDFYNVCYLLGLISDPKNVSSVFKPVFDEPLFDNSRKSRHPIVEKVNLQIVA